LHHKDARLGGATILVVEDSSVIAMELELILLAAGATEVMIATGIKDGRAFLGSARRFDVAIIGVFLDRPAIEMALAIAEAGCAVVLVADRPDALILTSPLDGAQRIEKPYSAAEVVEAVARSLRPAGAE
jgi:DNA-binding NtrC family response regulator